MATGSASRKRVQKQVPWRLILVAVALLVTAGWFLWPHTPLPQIASRTMLESVINQDYEWMVDNAFPEEKRIAGFGISALQQYSEDHLSELFGAQRIGGYVTFLDEPARGMSMARLRLKNGKEIEIAALGFAHDGKIQVGAMEALFALHRRLDTAMGRQAKRLAEMQDWFIKHGMEQLYMAQTDQMFNFADSRIDESAMVK